MSAFTIVDAATKAVAFTHDRSREHLDTDEMLRLALAKLVEIVGEAAKGVSVDTRARYPDVMWTAAGRMRDRLVHHYFDIDLGVLWNTVTVELPKLVEQLRSEK